MPPSLLAAPVALLLALAPAPAQTVAGRARAPLAPIAAPTRLDHPLSGLAWRWAQGGLGPVELDRSVGGPLAGDGQPLVVNQRRFAHGLGTHSTSVIAYDLGGLATTFGSWVGVDDEVASAGSVVFQVFGDGALLYQSPLMRGWEFARHTGRLDVRGVRELLLVVLDGGDGRAGDHADWGEPTLFAPMAPVGDGVALRATRGEWEPALAWPVTAMHATLLPTSRILSHASLAPDAPGSDPPGAPHDRTRVDLADVATWGHAAVDHPTEELFAAGHARLSRGGLLALGGHAGRAASGRPFGRGQASRFASQSAGWLPAAPLPGARWGATALTLGDGGVLALGGAHAGGNDFLPLAFGGGAWRRLSTASTAGWLAAGAARVDDTFPMAHLAPDGRVLWAGWGTDLALLDIRGSGTWNLVAPREPVRRAFGASVQVRPDRVLVIGGVDAPAQSAEARRDGVRIDLGGAAPVVAPIAPMLFRRADADATLLADGSVLVSGGAEAHAEGANSAAVRVPELYDPSSDTWRIAAAARHPRAYRSAALLLPDARVWTAGGDCGAGCASALTAEVFCPPYLFDAAGAAVPARPVLLSAPTRVTYRESFAAQVASVAAIQRVTLVRLGSATHGVNTDQRLVELPFLQAGSALQVSAPVDGNAAPPGPYMLFVLDAGGVPSVARVVEVGPRSSTTWESVPSTNGSRPTPRHEAAMVAVGGRLYLMGGRGNRPVEEYDPVAGVWRALGHPPFELHHLQPVVLDGLVYVVGAFTGPYPNESNVDRIWTWDPRTDVWTPGPQLPPGRARGSAGAVAYEGRIYLVGGNNQGHNGGARAWFDAFNPATQTWTTLPDAPRARDHFMAAVVGNQLVAAGGRTTDLPNPFDGTIPEVDVYDLGSGTWRTLANDLPTERAGTMTVALGQHVLVVGGESAAMAEAHADVEALDVLTGAWTVLPPLVEDRHSGGIGVVDGRVHVASGSGRAGGAPELDTLEVIDGARALLGASINLVANAGFDAGLAGWIDQGDLTLVAAAGVAPPGLRVESGWAGTSVPAQAAATYELRAFVRVSSAAGSAEARLEFLDSGGVVVGQAVRQLGSTGVLDTVSAVAVAPPGAVEARARFVASGARSVVVDDVVVVRR